MKEDVINIGKMGKKQMENRKSYPCPVCGTPNQLDGEGSDDTCLVCGWEDSGYQRRHPNEIGPNLKLTLHVAQEIWNQGKSFYKQFPNPNGNGV